MKRIGKKCKGNGKVIKYAFLLFLIFCATLAWADDIKFTASASKTQVGTDEQFEVTFTVNRNANGFSPPQFINFRILSGPNQSTSMSWINGVSSASTSFSYILSPLKAGEHTIPAATVTVGGERVSSNTLQISVVQGATQPSSSRPSQQGEEQEMRVSRKITDINKQLMIRAVVDKTNAYMGEQITLSYKLYTQLALSGNNLDQLPALNGFWSQDVNPQNQQVQWKREIYKGEEYNVAELKKSILFPERSGELTIDPMEMTFLVRQFSGGDSFFDQFFGAYEDVKYKIRSSPVSIHVKPLPEAGKPEGFSGAVGSFEVEATLDKNELKSNEALNYKIKISGTGNIPLINAPKVNFPADFEKYDPKVNDQLNESVTGISGSRTYEYLLIPRHQGQFNIDPVHFSYFNPATGKYINLQSSEFPVHVLQGDQELAGNTVLPGDQKAIKNIAQDIRYIKTGKADLYRTDDRFFGSQLFYFLLAAGPFAYFLALALRKWQGNRQVDEVKLRSKKANKLAAKYLAIAKIQLPQTDKQAFYEAVFKGLYGYLSDKLNIPVAKLNKDTITQELQYKSVPQDVINDVVKTLDLCEMARFAPSSASSAQHVFDQAKNIINDIENKI